MRTLAASATFAFSMAGLAMRLTAADAIEVDLERRFASTVRPFLNSYCTDCHGGKKPEAEFDLSQFQNLASVTKDHAHWALVLEKLEAGEMPSEKAKKFPTDQERRSVADWIRQMRTNEAHRHAGDPGIVLARRLSNAEYNYTVRDLTGFDIRPTREFPVDPANPAGFDNSGESLAMSPALLTKYLQAAREVASHLVLKPTGLAFAPHPMLVETDRDRYCVNQIVDFYRQQPTDYADYFHAAWRFKHRAALGWPQQSLADAAVDAKVSAKYLATVWRALEDAKEDVGPGAKLQAMWRALPVPGVAQASTPALRGRLREGCAQMRDFIVGLRAKLEPRFANLTGVRGISGTSQPFLMWKNRQYATHRRSYDRDALQIDGKAKADATAVQKPKMSVAAADALDEDAVPENAPKREGADPDLMVPSAERERYDAAFARFCAVFPDAFYVQERGRNYLDKTKDKGRLLSAGFHNVMGYFRDDQPLCELVLDEKQQKELDGLWQELDFIASATIRTYVQFYFNESGEARDPAKRADEKDVTKEPMVHALRENYLGRARPGNNATAIKAVEEHFDSVNATIRWVERAWTDAEPLHLRALTDFAARAFRRPLTSAERTDLTGYYASLRKGAGLSHEEAMRDAVASVLVCPDFCYRVDLVDGGAGIRPLSDHALASRLSYFLWSSAPDGGLLERAAAGELRRPEVIVAEARRMLQDKRVRGLATEFGANWLDFRRFEEHNAVDRERFAAFNNELRQAMFEEPIQFMIDVMGGNRPVLDFLYARHTFVNPALAKHYGMPERGNDAQTGRSPSTELWALSLPMGKSAPPRFSESADATSGGDWYRVDDADRYGRGGLLPMAVFLTKNAPGLRTSPVKRGYWVVKHVLGEHIPPPPAVVPELPRDEATTELPLREMLARHREDKSCASCHARFDSLGLVFEGYGPIGEKRTTDLAGRSIDARATFPGGMEGSGFEGALTYIRERRQDDFVDGLCRKLLAYALGRSLILSDDPLIAEMRTKVARDGYRFSSVIESIVTSPQFLTKRGREDLPIKGE